MIAPTRNYAIGLLAIALMPLASARAIDVPVQTAVQTTPHVAPVTPAVLTTASNESVAVTPVQWGYRGYRAYRPYYGGWGYRPYYGYRAYYGRPYYGGWGYARPYYSYRPYGYGYRPYGYRGFGYYPRYYGYRGPVWY